MKKTDKSKQQCCFDLSVFNIFIIEQNPTDFVQSKK